MSLTMVGGSIWCGKKYLLEKANCLFLRRHYLMDLLWSRLLDSPWGCWESDTTEQLHFHFHALEKELATHSSILAWRIPGMTEPAGLPSMGSQSRTWLKQLSSSSSRSRLLDRGWDGWMASQTQWTWVWASSGAGDGQGSLVCCSPWSRKESDTTEHLNWTKTSKLCLQCQSGLYKGLPIDSKAILHGNIYIKMPIYLFVIEKSVKWPELPHKCNSQM